MQQIVNNILSEIRSGLRFRWYGMLIAWIGCLVGWTFVASMPNVYEGTARVYVDTTSALQPVLRDQIAVQNVQSNLRYVTEALTGRDLLETVIRDVELEDPSGGGPPTAAHEALLDRLQQDIVVRSTNTAGYGQQANIYDISYRHNERAKAIGVVSTLLNALMQDTLEANQSGSDTAEQFLGERVAEYERRLQDAESALADFKKENADRLPGAEGDYFARMQTENEGLAAARRELRVLESKRDQLIQQLSEQSQVTPGTDPAAAENLPPNSIDARIRDYQAELDEKLLDYTEKHPDVIALREALETLTARRDEQLAALGLEGSDAEIAALGANPIYQALQISLNETNVEIATLRTDIEDRQERVFELQGLIDEVPEVEAQLARLNRDYDVVYEQYVELVRSRETQGITRAAADVDQVDFRIINPPLASPNPVAPPRVALFTLVLLGSIGAGAVACWVFAQMRPVFTGSVSLREVTGLPVLGVVSDGWLERARAERARAVTHFGGAFATLVFVFVCVLALEVFNVMPSL
jgi:polysaccharide chain length determinant protein (PEP-CTERM system associated)